MSTTTIPSVQGDTSETVTWPADRFYWSLLNAPMGRALSSQRAAPLPPGLCAAMQDDVPTPMEDLHAVGIRLDATNNGSNKVLAVAVRREALAELSSATRTLSPASIPPLDERLEQLEPMRLNVLVGMFEPRAIRRARALRHLLGMAAVLAAAGLLSAGLHRRAEHAASLADAVDAQSASLLSHAAESGVTDQRTLERELAQARALRTAMRDPQATADAIPALLSVLRSWPTSASATPQTLGVSGANGGEATLSVSVEGDPAEFLRQLTPPDGWTLDEPRLNASGSVTRVVLTLRRAKENSLHNTGSNKETAR